MEIYHCERCSSLVPPGDIESGQAAKAPEKGYYCAKCASEARQAERLQGPAPATEQVEEAGQVEAEVAPARRKAKRRPMRKGAARTGRGERGAAGRVGRSDRRGRRRGARAEGPARAGPGGCGSRMSIVAGFLAAVAVAGVLIAGRDRPSTGDADGPGSAGAGASVRSGGQGEESGQDKEGGQGEEGGTEKPPAGTAEAPSWKPESPKESQKERAAREAFENISSLAGKGEIDDAASALADGRKALAGTEYLDRASDLVLRARGDRAVAEVRRLARQRQYEWALQAAERALLEKLSREHQAELRELAEEFREKVAETEEEKRKGLADLERRREEERSRREEERRREEELARLERRRAECDKLRGESKGAASRRDYGKALRLLEKAEGLAARRISAPDEESGAVTRAAGFDDLRGQIAADVVRVKVDAQVTKARSLVKAGKIDEGIAALEAGVALKGDEQLACAPEERRPAGRGPGRPAEVAYEEIR